MKHRDFLHQARTYNSKQLAAKIVEGKKTLLALNQDKILGKLKDTNKIRLLRREIATYATLLDEAISKELEKA